MNGPFPGPHPLGRGVVVGPDAPAPDELGAAPRIRVDEATLRRPGDTVAELSKLWVTRTPVTIELAVDTDQLRQPEDTDRAPYELAADFEFSRERLQFLVWANNYDARSGAPIWWHARKAARLGGRPDPTGTADLTLPDGRAAWCDGGPRGPVEVDHPVVHRESIERGTLHTSPTRIMSDTAGAGLAADQRKAVLHGAGPARVIAPAGSGKTRTLTARLRHLLSDRWLEPEIVTAVAYNTRAADEMRGRMGTLDANIRTIHSLAYAIVRLAGRPSELIDERRQRAMLDGLIPRQPQQNRDVTAPYLEALTQVRIGLTHPETVEDLRDDVPDFPTVFHEYRRRLGQAGVIDFDEQIYQAIEVMLADPAIRDRVQRSARHLLVDEFQDLTPAYLLLLRLVAAPSYQVFGVGDDDQVIYGYTGATPEYLIEFDRLFPGAGHYALETNYRCPSDVVSGARHLLGYNRRRIPKSITSGSDRTGGLTAEVVAPAGMAVRVGEHIDRWWATGAPLTDIAVLSRVNHALLPVQAILDTLGVPHMAPVGVEFLRRTAIRAFLAYLRIGVAPDLIARRDLEEVIGRPARRISRAGRTLLGRRPRWSLSLLREAVEEFDAGSRSRFEGFVADLESVADAVAAGTTAEVVGVVRRSVGLDDAAALLDGSRTAADRSGHGDDLAALAQVAALHDDPITFETWLGDLLRRPGSSDGVTLSTIHRVKGMEWPFVVVYPAARDVFPHRLAEDVEEERRVFHVAITRSRNETVVVGDGTRPSRFVGELDGSAPKGRTEEPPPATGGLVPTIGQAIRWGGLVGTVTGFGDDGALMSVDGGDAAVRVPWRDRVTIDGITAPLARPLPDEPDVAVFEALRAWRKEQAAEQDVPAYIVMSDKHLRGIAARLPGNLHELLECPGVGPTKLDAYGEAILEVVASAGSPSA